VKGDMKFNQMMFASLAANFVALKYINHKEASAPTPLHSAEDIPLNSIGPQAQPQTDQVPILPKVTNIGLQIFVTDTLYIFVTFNQYSLAGQVFSQLF
jgi:hypothetical protein